MCARSDYWAPVPQAPVHLCLVWWQGDGIEFKRTFVGMCDLLFEKDAITAATQLPV